MSKWDKIVKRDSLQAFPCVADLHCIEAGDDQCEDPNFAPCPDPGRCALRPIFEEYMVLRAVVEADLAGTTPRQAEIVCAVSIGLETDKTVLATLRRKRKAWEDLT